MKPRSTKQSILLIALLITSSQIYCNIILYNSLKDLQTAYDNFRNFLNSKVENIIIISDFRNLSSFICLKNLRLDPIDFKNNFKYSQNNNMMIKTKFESVG